MAPGAPGGELLAAPWALHVSAIGLATAEATPLQFPRPTESFSAGSTVSFDFQSFRNAKTAERKTTKARKGQLFAIVSRIATVAAPATTSAAQIEFAASQNRQEVTKLDEKECDEPLETLLCTAPGEKLLMYRLTLVATLIVVPMLLTEFALFRSRRP